jgi:hypothetical protein
MIKSLVQTSQEVLKEYVHISCKFCFVYQVYRIPHEIWKQGRSVYFAVSAMLARLTL